MNEQQTLSSPVQVEPGRATNRFRLLKLSRGDTWPERRFCELALVLECPSKGLAITELDCRLYEGELALLPLGNGLQATTSGRVLSVQMEGFQAPKAPQRISDSLIAQLMRRAWSSVFSTPEIIGPTLDLIEILADRRIRVHQEQLDFLETLDPRIAVVMDYIDANCGDTLTVKQLAAIACLSPSQLSAKFRLATDETVWGYLQRRRCERARQLLVDTTSPIAEIAYQVGFSSQAHLTQSFKKRFGTTPGRLRQR